MADRIFHITTATGWAAAARSGRYVAPSLDDEGFIHASTAAQVAATAARFYADADDLVLLEIDPDALDAEVRWEQATDVDERFPHVYGPVTVAAVVAVHPFGPRPDGTFPTPG